MGHAAEEAPPVPVRSLNPEREQAILEAALALLTDVGYDRMSVDEVARRARASKATIYRRWPGKAALVATVLRRLAVNHPPLPDTGTLRGDLLAALALLSQVAERKHALLRGTLSAIRDDPELARLLRRNVTESGTAEAAGLLGRAYERGELPASADPALVLELADALVWRRLLVTGEPLDDAFITHAVDRILLPIAHVSARMAV